MKWHWFDSVLITIIAALIVRSFFFQSYKVESDSMKPTLLKGDLILCFNPFWNKNFRAEKIHRNDIIVFKAPVFPYEEYVKRVVGIQGDALSVSSNCVFIDGVLCDPLCRRSSEGLYYNMADCLVETNSVFVMGDNRGHSSDSRAWGTVPLTRVNGKCLMIYWPLKHVHLFF